MIDEGYLARPEILPLTTGQSFRASADDARAYADTGELRRSLLKRIAEDELRNQYAANAIVEHANEWGKLLIFTTTVRQARSLREQLADSDVRAGIVTGAMKPNERQEELDRFRNGRRKILINVNVLSEGTDLPNVDTVLLARPTRSQVSFQQMVGRGMRGPKVGGTHGCRIVVLQDEIQGLVEHQLTHNYGWEVAQLRKLGLLEVGLDSLDESIKGRHEDEGDAGRRALVDQVVEHLRDIFEELELKLPGPGSPLLGWWELPDDAVMTKAAARPRLLPFFKGDDELHRGLAALADALADGAQAGRDLPRARWVRRSTLAKFWDRAIDSRTPPVYTKLGEASAERTLGLYIDLLAVAAEDAPHDRRHAATERLLKLIGRAENRWTRSWMRRVRAELSADPEPEPDGQSEPIPADLWRLYDAAQYLLGPQWLRDRISQVATRHAKRAVEAKLRILVGDENDRIGAIRKRLAD